MTIIKHVAIAGLASLTLGTAAEAQVVSMATGAQGSLAYNSGQAVARIANDNGITVRTQPLVGYMPLLQTGEIDFGFSNGVEAEFAFEGTGNFDRAHPDVRLVGTMFNLTTGIMAPCDLGLASVADLQDRPELRIASEYTSSTIIPFYIKGALASGGLGYEDFTNVPVSSFVDGINALGDGLVDIALVSLNAGAGQQAAVQLKDRGGLCYISLDDSAEGTAAYKEYLSAGTIVPMAQNENVTGLANAGANLMAIPWVLLTNAGVSDDLIYDMVKAIAENQQALGEAFGAFKRADFTKMAPASATPYHAGALRYYEEAGIATGE